jgi:hypothetical protein
MNNNFFQINTIPVKDVLINNTQALFPLDHPSVILANIKHI